MKQIFIVNGKPRAGKDTFAEILDKYVSVYKYSSIDKIKSIAIDCGWTGGKTERDRKFLSDLKNLTSNYSDMAFMDIMDKVVDFYCDKIKEDVLIIDIREPNEIERARTIFNAKTIFIKNDNVESIASNMADANVEKYTYDFIVENNGTLEDFEDTIKRLLVNDFKGGK